MNLPTFYGHIYRNYGKFIILPVKDQHYITDDQ